MIGIFCHESHRQVGILEIDMVGVCRVTRFLLGEHQLVFAQQTQERVAPTDEFTPKFPRQQHMQLNPANPWGLYPIPLNIFYDYLYTLHLGVQHLALLVVPLPTLVKQTAKSTNALLWVLLAERIYCLTPSFFNIEMPSSRSAISMTFSRARQRMRSICRLRSRDDIRS